MCSRLSRDRVEEPFSMPCDDDDTPSQPDRCRGAPVSRAPELPKTGEGEDLRRVAAVEPNARRPRRTRRTSVPFVSDAGRQYSCEGVSELQVAQLILADSPRDDIRVTSPSMKNQSPFRTDAQSPPAPVSTLRKPLECPLSEGLEQVDVTRNGGAVVVVDDAVVKNQPRKERAGVDGSQRERSSGRVAPRRRHQRYQCHASKGPARHP